jgi:hypothetical protein
MEERKKVKGVARNSLEGLEITKLQKNKLKSRIRRKQKKKEKRKEKTRRKEEQGI